MNKTTLIKELHIRGIELTDKQVDELFDLMKSTLETNEKFNLTAIKDEESFLEKMVFDSAIALQGVDLTDKTAIDVGTGAGFPGMVLYILNPQVNLTLLDSTKKKIDYLRQYCEAHNYKVNCISARAEEFAMREGFDYAFARAVAPLNILLELIIPMLKVGGTFVALKGQGFEDELVAAEKAMSKLGCHLKEIIEDELPECGEKRALIHIVKDKVTNTKYPRQYSEIKKLPL